MRRSGARLSLSGALCVSSKTGGSGAVRAEYGVNERLQGPHFDSDSGFRNLVEVQLRKLLNRRIYALPLVSGGSAGPAACRRGGGVGDEASEVESEQVSALDWGGYRRTAVLSHPILLERWDPFREWLDKPENRED